MVFHRASEFPKSCCLFVEVNEEENQFLVQIHRDFWSTSNFHNDCIKYTSTVEINTSENRTASILTVNKN